jgi:predicted NBD/HSP70 family sugar kinase
MSNSSDPTWAPPLRAAGESRGTNQTGVRLYNERLVLSLVRRHGALAKAEMARMTGLSPQTATVIVNRLEADGLLVRQARQRGRIGQPAAPFALNPSGAYAFGLKMGRRSSSLVLIDFLGRVIARAEHVYDFPVPPDIRAFVAKALTGLSRGLSAAARARICGFGIAAPFELWNWEAEIGAPRKVLDAWRSFDLRAELQQLTDSPVLFCNDATAACAAELAFGRGSAWRDFVYFFIGSFVGGGVVINGSLYPGRTGNAGALGSMPVAGAGGIEQLIRSASLYRLTSRPDDPPAERERKFAQWMGLAAPGLALAIASSASVIDFQAAIIDGAFDACEKALLVEHVRACFARLDRRGLSALEIEAGSLGADARAVGAASLPFLANFARDREVLFKEGEAPAPQIAALAS